MLKYTVAPLFRGHPRDQSKCSLNEGRTGFCSVINNLTKFSFFYKGDIGGYPIPQYRNEHWQIPKYRVKNRRHTDTALKLCIPFTVYFYSSDTYVTAFTHSALQIT